MKIKSLNTTQQNFNKKLSEHLSFKQKGYQDVELVVDRILKNIQINDDKGLLSLIKKHDNTSYKKISNSIVTQREIVEAYSFIPKKIIQNHCLRLYRKKVNRVNNIQNRIFIIN